MVCCGIFSQTPSLLEFEIPFFSKMPFPGCQRSGSRQTHPLPIRCGRLAAAETTQIVLPWRVLFLRSVLEQEEQPQSWCEGGRWRPGALLAARPGIWPGRGESRYRAIFTLSGAAPISNTQEEKILTVV